MPKYQYQCKDCGEGLEVQQGFTDEALTVCPQCGGDLRKVFGAVGVVFKGSGFYKTDSRSASPSGSSSSSSTTSSDSSAGTKGASKGTSDSTAKPAASGSGSSSGAQGASSTSGSAA